MPLLQQVVTSLTLLIVEETRKPEKEVSVSPMDSYANKVGFFLNFYLNEILLF